MESSLIYNPTVIFLAVVPDVVLAHMELVWIAACKVIKCEGPSIAFFKFGAYCHDIKLDREEKNERPLLLFQLALAALLEPIPMQVDRKF